ncbi:MAG: hypothetical protein BWY42_01611 [Candidatus Omnitrophica bacterium ADurb.Bin277]|nr:MAG: hypothetical protein BWY42_01611 [Candidatus Omnitrophica bacterium ADurb.Bin277]
MGQSSAGQRRCFIQRAIFEEEQLRQSPGAVKKLQPERPSFFPQTFPQNSPHQVFHPVRAIDPSHKRTPALIHGIQGCPVAVNRNIHHGARLYILVDLLDQSHSSGQGGRIPVSGPLHSRTPNGIRKHIVTKSNQVAAGKRLKVNNGGINIPLAGRMHGIVRETFVSHRLNVPG